MTIQYFGPSINVTNSELYDIAANQVKPEEWHNEGFKILSENKDIFILQKEYSDESVGVVFQKNEIGYTVRVDGLRKRTVDSNVKRISRILKINLERIVPFQVD